MSDCVFCRIISNDEPASLVHRDDRVTAFLDHAPVNDGHTVIAANEHTATVADLDPEVGAQMFRVALRVSRALRASEALRCDGVDMWLADGEAAFGRVAHPHLHVFPRYRGDGFAITRRNWSRASREALESAAEPLREALGEPRPARTR